MKRLSNDRLTVLVAPSQSVIDEAILAGDVIVVDDRARTDLRIDSGVSFIECPFTPEDLKELVDLYLGDLKISAVCSISERGVYTASVLRGYLGAGFGPIPTAVSATQDKALFRQLLETPVTRDLNPKWWVSDLSIESPHGHPLTWRDCSEFIVKLRVGTGSNQIRLISRDEFPADDSLAGFIVEERISGTEFSIEACSEDSGVSAWSFTRKYTDTLTHVELGHVVPSGLSGDLELRVIEQISTMLRVLQCEFSVSHTEVFVGTRGVKVVETHFRAGGDGITNLTKQATGLDLEASAISLSVGGSPVWSASAHPAIAICFVHLGVGRVNCVYVDLSVLSIEERSRVLEVTSFLSVEEHSSSLKSSSDRSGCAIAVGSDIQAARDLASRAVSSLAIDFHSDLSAHD